MRIRELSGLLSQQDLTLNLSEESMEWLAREGFDPEYGARPLQSNSNPNPNWKVLIQNTGLGLSSD